MRATRKGEWERRCQVSSAKCHLTPEHLTPEHSHSQKGQTMAEFAIVMPVLILLLFGMMLAAFYAFRAASADWGVFITGVATGAYNTPATEQARKTVLWPDIQGSISTTQHTSDRMVRSQITIEDSKPWVYGINLVEANRGTAVFRLWRFYPGPPTGVFE